VEAIRIHVRYESPDDNGVTRRQRNEIAGEYTPEFCVPDAGRFIWDVYFRISNSYSRTIEGFYRLIPPSEIKAWCSLTKTFLRPAEYDIISAMDRVYCEEANKEIDSIRSKQQEEHERQIEKQRAKARRS